MTALLLLTVTFSAIFSAPYYSFCSYFNDCAGCGIMTACFCCGDSGPKRLLNAVSSAASRAERRMFVRELTCSAEKPALLSAWL